MPVFEIIGEDKTIIGRATFDKQEDFGVYTRKDDKLKIPHMLHVIQGEALVKKGTWEKVKDAKLDVRETETVVTKIPKK